jgi:periplasmic divalent cation tolerance protein
VSGDYGMLMTTTPSHEDAARLARLLVEEKLAACVQLMPIDSVFFWKGKTQEEKETLMLVKTRTALFDAAIARIKGLHRYEVPEIVAMPFTAGSAPYFQWMDEVTCTAQN